ncbi:MAG: hypothetical protein MJZ13_09590 [Bacteroidales bacterium]|nr:hypothetical protein [Bacteroidales bacterium]
MKTILKILVVCVMLSLHACDDDASINYNKYVFRNECSSDMTLSYVKTIIFNGEKTNEYRHTFPVIPQQKELVQVMGTGNTDVRSETGEWMLCSDNLNIYIELADSIINCPYEYDGDMSFEYAPLLLVLTWAWREGSNNPYDYEEKADTAIYTYTFTDERIERLVDYYMDHEVYPTKK